MKRLANNVLSAIAKIIAFIFAIFFIATTLAALFLFQHGADRFQSESV